MNSIKCKNCGLSNFSSEVECRRCGHLFREVKVGKRPPRFSLSGLLMISVLSGLAYYIYIGTETSFEQINANDAKRAAAQPTIQPGVGLSRSDYDRQRAGNIGDTVRNSASLAAHQEHINETEKAMHQVSNSDATK